MASRREDNKIVKLTKQRDALLAACKGMVDDYEHLAFPEDDKKIEKARRKIVVAARAAIAKATQE